MLDKLAISDFESLLEASITLEFAGNAETAVVTDVKPITGDAAAERQPFSLTLRTETTDHFWPQGIYRMLHPVHGPLDLFMVPIGPDEQGMRYQVIFN